MAQRRLPARPDAPTADAIRLEVHEILLAHLLACVARTSGTEGLSGVFIGAQQHMINLRVMRGEDPRHSPEIAEIERQFERLGALLHAVLIKYARKEPMI